MPIDTMMPVTPARVRARLLVWLSSGDDRVQQRPADGEAEDHDQAERPGSTGSCRAAPG